MSDLKELIKQFEGNRSRIYDDATGKDIDWNRARELGLIEGIATVGIGRNIEANPFSQAEIDLMFKNDRDMALVNLENIFGCHTKNREYYIDEVIPNCTKNRLIALISIMFNLGLSTFKDFKKMIRAIKEGDWNEAADESLDSDRYKVQGAKLPGLKKRCELEAEMLRNG